VYDPEGYAAMAWYYRSIMTTVIPAMITTCKTQYDVAWVGFVIGPKIGVDTMRD
jgi:hypothetical protein